MTNKLEQIFLFLVLLFLPVHISWQIYSQFSYIYSTPLSHLSPTIYLWDLLVIVLIAIFVLGQRQVNRAAFNLLFFLSLSQIFSLFPLFNNATLSIGPGLVKIEQYLVAGLFGLYMASNKISLSAKWLIYLTAVILFFGGLLYLRYLGGIGIKEDLVVASEAMWRSSPILGIGLNNFIPAAVDRLMVGPNFIFQPVSNIYLLILAETGIIGLLGWLILLGYPIWRLVRFIPLYPYLIPLILLWIIVLALGLFDNFLLVQPEGYRLFFLVWGLTLGVVSTKIGKSEKNP